MDEGLLAGWLAGYGLCCKAMCRKAGCQLSQVAESTNATAAGTHRGTLRMHKGRRMASVNAFFSVRMATTSRYPLSNITASSPLDSLLVPLDSLLSTLFSPSSQLSFLPPLNSLFLPTAPSSCLLPPSILFLALPSCSSTPSLVPLNPVLQCLASKPPPVSAWLSPADAMPMLTMMLCWLIQGRACSPLGLHKQLTHQPRGVWQTAPGPQALPLPRSPQRANRCCAANHSVSLAHVPGACRPLQRNYFHGCRPATKPVDTRIASPMCLARAGLCREADLTAADPQQDLLTPALPCSCAWRVQAFAEKLFSRLQTRNETFDTRMAILLVVSRVIGLHKWVFCAAAAVRCSCAGVHAHSCPVLVCMCTIAPEPLAPVC